MLVVRKSVLDAHPREVRALYEMFLEGKRRMAPQPGGIDFLPFGIEATRRALEVVIDLAHEQGIIVTKFDVDELYEDARRVLGTLAS
jgi:4,5-dihydroxyphthalate decarboxylase